METGRGPRTKACREGTEEAKKNPLTRKESADVLTQFASI